jgi:TolA-binding protein
MTPSIKSNPLTVPVTLQTTRPAQASPLAVTRRNSAALAFLGAMLLVLALVVGVSMSAVASGGVPDIVRTIKTAFGATDTLAVEQEYQAQVIQALERRIQAVTAEVRGLTSRQQINRYQDAAVSDRFSTIETDIAAVTAELRTLRGASNPTSAARIDFLEATVVEVGGGVTALRSSFDAFAESQRKEIADLAASTRKDITAITTRINRIEQALAARDVTSSIPTPPRKKKVVKKRRPAATVARASAEPTPFQAAPHPLFPGPVGSVR